MLDASPRFFSTEFKVDLVARLQRGDPVARVARETPIGVRTRADGQ